RRRWKPKPLGGKAEAEERRAAGRRISPEAVTEHDEGLMWRDTQQRQGSRWVSRRCHPPDKRVPSPDLDRATGERQSVTDGTVVYAATLTLKSTPSQQRSRHPMLGEM